MRANDSMPNSLRLFSYTAPTEIRCAVAAPNRTSAAKLLGTTAETLKVRGKEHERADHAPDEDIAGLQLAEANPQKVFIKKNGEWEELPEKKLHLLLSQRQLTAKGNSNRQILDAPMSTHSIRTDDETWLRFIAIGGGVTFRDWVNEEFARQAAKDPAEMDRKLREARKKAGSKSR
ncbi:hypothetical protein ACR3H8_19480 [Pseudomonas aeruginosa]|uniref:hypothetical protein n=1 Tax=Pseudomonas aeruginosa group TaxID=136841 RepID=UPI000F822559|nr:hypothetical protein [Pseudomonas aeruginosa]ELD5773001.1 hypothetical protein [Pseudomonas aeruginosa]MBG4607010.1 hypothetical protein [Pseudomonas aeruginosa]MBG5536917.1 hypothetical protein [Pseudomonas aeruginosa]MBG5780329.1 hypothetical protein [Pseudomonas aeruginosa]MBH4465054.1 hypothetical protein [Pseudomonas aeruginosa]